MRLDLHNHTLPATSESAFIKFQRMNKQSWRDVYLQLIKHHHLDGLAITNSHNIEIAMGLAKEYPKHIIVGAEYQVIGGEGLTLQIVALGIDLNSHYQLMEMRLQGISHFTSFLKEQNIPYFWAHIGWGISPEHPQAPKMIEKFLSYFDAIEVMNVHGGEETQFARALAQYYNLAPIGGSDHIIFPTGRRAYTEAIGAKNIQEFFLAIQNRQVKASLTLEPPARPTVFSSQVKNNFYFKELHKIWHSEFGYHRDLSKNLGETFLLPLLEWLPYGYYLQQRKIYEKKVSRLQERFIEYLQLKESKKIFSQQIPIQEKKSLLQEKLARIYEIFIAHS